MVGAWRLDLSDGGGFIKGSMDRQVVRDPLSTSSVFLPEESLEFGGSRKMVETAGNRMLLGDGKASRFRQYGQEKFRAGRHEVI